MDIEVSASEMNLTLNAICFDIQQARTPESRCPRLNLEVLKYLYPSFIVTQQLTSLQATELQSLQFPDHCSI